MKNVAARRATGRVLRRAALPLAALTLLALPAWAQDSAPAAADPIADALATPKVKDMFAAQGLEAAPDTTPQQLTRFIASETAKWQAVVRQSGAQLD